MTEIFVSYRRNDSASETGRLVEHLKKYFGKSAIFNDVYDIKGGQKFRDVISSQLEQTQVLLVVIGNRWIDATDGSGERRLENAEDYVRFEIATALINPNCVVVPVLLDNQAIPDKDVLPQEIEGLVERHAVRVRPDPDFTDDMDNLCRLIAEYVPPKKKWPLLVSVVIFVFAVILIAFFMGPGQEKPDTVLQVFDSSTEERILRSFTIFFTDDRPKVESADAQYRFVDKVPSELNIKGIECEGFDSIVSKQVIEEGTEKDESNKDYLMRVFIDRWNPKDPDSIKEEKRVNHTTYFDSIEPGINNVEGLPDDSLIADQVGTKELEAGKVELIVKNLTDQHIDVLMYWWPPSSNKNISNPFIMRWTHINEDAIQPGEQAYFKSFGLNPGYFLFFVSVNAKKAVFLKGAALYKAPYAILKIKNLNKNGFSLDYSESRPSENH